MTNIENLDKRLQTIETYLLFFGRISRHNLIDHFDFGTATASRLLKAYNNSFPNNLSYDVHKRTYVITDTFVVAYPHDIEQSLKLFAYGESSKNLNSHTLITSGIARLNYIIMDINVVSAITRSIISNSGINAKYISVSSGEQEKKLLPKAIFCSSNYWYVRALDMTGKDYVYKTYKLNRFLTAQSTVLSSNKVDDDWVTDISLTIAPHNQHPSPKALAVDLGMVNKPVINITTNKILAGFYLSDKRVDCSDDFSLSPYMFPFMLMNKHELSEFESLKIAPGWES